jgi:hypothetical protein
MVARTAPMTCPSCHATLDAHHLVNGHGFVRGNSTPPQPGDLTICETCQSIGIVARSITGMMIRPPTLEERQAALENPNVLSAIWTSVGRR